MAFGEMNRLLLLLLACLLLLLQTSRLEAMMAGSGRLQGLLASHSLTSTTSSSSSLRTIADALQKKAEPISDSLSKVGDAVWRKRVLDEARAMAGRLPMALRESVFTSSSSFLQSAVMLIPIGLLLNVQLLRSNVVEWLRKGAAVGVEWSKIGAVFVVQHAL